jgi:hypothetical protein
MPFDLHPSFIAEAERKLDCVLPATYKTAMLQSNGGELDVLDDDWQQYPIADTSDRKRTARTSNDIVRETNIAQKWKSFPTGAVAIAGNGTGDQLLFLRENSILGNAVFHWSHETGELSKVASNYGDLYRV